MPFSRRTRIWLSIAGAVVITLAAIVLILIIRFQPIARDYVIAALRQRYKSEVTLGNLQISLFPEVRATADNLTLRLGGRRDVPPMVTVHRVVIQAPFLGLFRYPKHIETVRLEGLQIHIPPRSSSEPPGSGGFQSDDVNLPFVLDDVIADGSTLQTLPADPSKQPLTFEIRKLRLHTVGKGLPMTFVAELMNAKPPGVIRSEGRFGPWKAESPDQTAISGKYTFRDADLGVFKGITGTLSSDGRYQGQLARIEVQGTTEVPDFALTLANNPMHLHTDFSATVDGTNGNTTLHPVRAVLGHSAFHVAGAIERGAFEHHKVIDLTAKTSNGNVDDFLRLAMKSNPPLTGAIRFDTAVRIPPGEVPVIERLQLRGTFGMGGVHFTSPSVEEKIASLSHHAEGQPENHDTTGVVADFRGQFRLANGLLTLPHFEFDFPGARVNLSGTYALVSGAIDFNGTAKMDAKVSQMTTGWKSLVLKPVDRIFEHDGAGTELPIGIGGTRGSPSFRIDIGAALFHRKK